MPWQQEIRSVSALRPLPGPEDAAVPVLPARLSTNELSAHSSFLRPVTDVLSFLTPSQS